MIDVKKVGEYLKKLREDKGVTLRDLGTETGFCNSYLSQMEMGQWKVLERAFRTIKQLCQYYDISTMDFFKESGLLSIYDKEESEERKIEKTFQELMLEQKILYIESEHKFNIATKKFILDLVEKIKKST